MNSAMVLGAVALAAASGASAQTSPMYVISQDSATIGVLQGGALINSFPTGYGPGGQYLGALAVNGDIRFTGTFSGGSAGTRLQLDGTPTGDSYPQPGIHDIYDGTTDGKYIYTAGYASGEVYRMNLDYSAPTLLMSTGQSGTIGVTFDSSNNTLWTHNTDNGTITNWGTDGSFIAQFTLPFAENWRGLAYDAADDTLWLTAHDYFPGAIRQVSKTGALLNEYTIPGLAALGGTNGPLAAEFDLRGIPAPGSLGLMGVAGLAMARRRR